MAKKEYLINYNAYTFELIQNTTELFRKDTISATYIIHLEENGRLDNVKEQINKFKTSEFIFILHNKGYKNVIKQDYINKPRLDLVDAFLTIFKHAHNNNYKSILIFEDDFICDDKLLDTNITNKICDFIDKHNSRSIIYYLGTLPFIIEDTNNDNVKCLISVGTHSLIYSSKFVDMALNCDQTKIKDWDMFVNNQLNNQLNIQLNINNFDRYMYKHCLCYQTFPSTENQKNWCCLSLDNVFINNLLNKFICGIAISFYKSLKMDEEKDINKKYKLFYDMCLKIPNYLLLN